MVDLAQQADGIVWTPWVDSELGLGHSKAVQHGIPMDPEAPRGGRDPSVRASAT